MMKQVLLFLCLSFFCALAKGQDTLFTKSILGIGYKNLSVSNPVYVNGKVVFFVSNPVDSVATAVMKMVILDTCGNVEKIHTIPLEGHWGITFGGTEVVLVTQDGNFIVSGNQFLPNTDNRGQLVLMKLNLSGNVLLEWKLKTKLQRFNPTKVLEIANAYYITGITFGSPPPDINFFLLKMNKELKYQWTSYAGYAADIKERNDTINLMGFNDLIKLYEEGTTLKGIRVKTDSLRVDNSVLSKFLDDERICHIQTVPKHKILGNPEEYFNIVETDYNLHIKINKYVPFLTNQKEYADAMYYDYSKNNLLLSSRISQSQKLLLRKFDKNKDLQWIRVDTISHYKVKNRNYYEFYHSFIFLESGNCLGIILTNDKDFVNNEVRVIKFDKNGIELLRNCENSNSANDITLDKIPIAVFPNPFSSQTTFSIQNEEYINSKLEIMDMLGRVVKQATFKQKTIIWSKDNSPSGVYFYRLIFNGKIINSGKLVIE